MTGSDIVDVHFSLIEDGTLRFAVNKSIAARTLYHMFAYCESSETSVPIEKISNLINIYL